MKANSLIVCSLLVAMCFSIITLPSWMLWLRPEFTLIVLMYWSLAIPERCGLMSAMLVGLFQDSLTASFLGQHMLAYTLVIALILFTYQRLRMLGIWQQALFVFLLLSIGQLVEYWIAMLRGPSSPGYWILLPPLVGALFWPGLMISLRGLRRKIGLVNKIV